MKTKKKKHAELKFIRIEFSELKYARAIIEHCQTEKSKKKMNTNDKLIRAIAVLALFFAVWIYMYNVSNHTYKNTQFHNSNSQNKC